jgi:hypothetical protein
MSLAEVFVNLFDDPQAQARIKAYHPHSILNTFNLATTSLRHIPKWYDRLADIAKGVAGGHGNYYSDPQALGLVTKTGTPSLTAAGQEFLNSRKLYYGDPKRAEYFLNKILYFGPNSPLATSPILQLRRRNLYAFLRKCRPTPNTRLVVGNDRLLTIAELISSFGSALENFLLLPESDLQAFSALGEGGFGALLDGMTVNPGYVTLTGKIGGEYTRARERRRNYLFSHLFLSLRDNLKLSKLMYASLAIPYPFANLISPEVANDEVGNFTDDIKIEPSAGSYLVFLNEVASTAPPPSPPTIQPLQLATPKKARPRGTTTGFGQHQTGTVTPYFVDAPLTVEAEDYIERTLRAKYGKAVRRIGHTAYEFVPLKDGVLPGADLVVEDNTGILLRCAEVKSAKGSLPGSIRLTASEYARAIKCQTDNIPYDLYVVVFTEIQQVPIVSLLADFHISVGKLSIADLTGMEIRISKT